VVQILPFAEFSSSIFSKYVFITRDYKHLRHLTPNLYQEEREDDVVTLHKCVSFMYDVSAVRCK